MDATAIILEMIKNILPALVVLIATSLIVNRFLLSQTRIKQLSVFQETQDTTLRLRLQAYERLVIYLERISPRHLLPRIYDQSMTVFELQQSITFNVLTEFDHNLSQQIYISQVAWDTVKNVKEQIINMGIAMAQQLNQDAPARELYNKLLHYMMEAETELPTDAALRVVNDEVRKIMSYGSY